MTPQKLSFHTHGSEPPCPDADCSTAIAEDADALSMPCSG